MSSVKIKGSPTGTAVFTVSVPDGTSTDRTIELPDAAGSFVLADASGDVTVTGDLTVDTDTLHVDSANNRVGVGTASPYTQLEISSADPVVRFNDSNGGTDTKNFEIRYVGTTSPDIDGLYFRTVNDANTVYSDKMVLDGSGNLLVGKTATGVGNYGFAARGVDGVEIARDGGVPLFINRGTSDGTIIDIRKDNVNAGRILTAGGDIQIGTGENNLYFNDGASSMEPRNSNGVRRDNAIDMGHSSARFDDIYATNGTIQTSDLNLKTAISSLTDAEITAAKAISKLFKTFKWNDKVAEKGDAARTHSGVIAQEVQQAMTDAGLDAGNYAFFISSTWWETQTEVPAVEADEENGIEAQEAYTRTDTYETAEEAPAGATERTRLGIRYPELLSFVGAATEQRLASIEARLDALEAV